MSIVIICSRKYTKCQIPEISHFNLLFICSVLLLTLLVHFMNFPTNHFCLLVKVCTFCLLCASICWYKEKNKYLDPALYPASYPALSPANTHPHIHVHGLLFLCAAASSGTMLNSHFGAKRWEQYHIPSLRATAGGLDRFPKSDYLISGRFTRRLQGGQRFRSRDRGGRTEPHTMMLSGRVQ